MYCKNCGSELNENAVACIKCGCDPKKGINNCPSCGVELKPEQIICVKCGVSLTNQTNSNNSNKAESRFPIPLVVGWVVNVVAWILFVATFNHAIEISMGLLCAGCVFVGYKHKQINTPAFLGLHFLSANNLIYSSAFEAVWMFAWGFGLFGNFHF